jgi:hypothetical protein
MEIDSQRTADGLELIRFFNQIRSPAVRRKIIAYVKCVLDEQETAGPLASDDAEHSSS